MGEFKVHLKKVGEHQASPSPSYRAGARSDAAHSQPLFSAEAPTSQASAGIRMKTRITRGTKGGGALTATLKAQVSQNSRALAKSVQGSCFLSLTLNPRP